MRRRLLPHVCMLITLLAWPPVAAAKPAPSWAQADLNAVVAAGLMAKEAAARPNDPLTRGELETIVAGLAPPGGVPPRPPPPTVTMAPPVSPPLATPGPTPTAQLFTPRA